MRPQLLPLDRAGTPPTVRDVIDAYLRYSASNDVHGTAARQEREYTLGLFAADFGNMPVGDCKQFHLSDFIGSHPGWKSPATKRQKASAVRAAFNWALREERIDRNPFRAVKFPEAERRPDMPDDLLARIEAVASKPFEAALRFLRLTGCRVTELCEAQWVNIDFGRGLWVISKHKSRRATGKAKVIVLTEQTLALLRSLPQRSQVVFENTRGHPWTRRTLYQSLRRTARRHGFALPASLHGIRHRFGTAAIARGAPLKLVSAQLGHASTEITERYYVDLTNELNALRKAAEAARPSE